MNSEMLPGACTTFDQIFGLTQCHNDPNSPESKLAGCAIQTCPSTVEKANPITCVTANEPPMLLLHGENDTLVPYQQSILLHNALAAQCDSAQMFLAPGAGHDVNDVLSSSHYGSQPAPGRAARSPWLTVITAGSGTR